MCGGFYSKKDEIRIYDIAYMTTNDYQIEYRTKTGTLILTTTNDTSISFEGISHEEANILTLITQRITEASNIEDIKTLLGHLLQFSNAPLLSMIIFSWVNSYIFRMDYYIRKTKRGKRDEFKQATINDYIKRKNVALEILK